MASDAAALVRAVDTTLSTWRSTQPNAHLLVALSKSLPRSELAHMVKSITAHVPSRVGMLVPPLSASTVRPTTSGTLHTAALTLFPSTHAVPFRSTIPGTTRIAVGRWPNQKEAWHQRSHSRADRLDSTGEWQSLWGRENVDGIVPPELADVEPSEIDAIVFASDAHPQGLIEGLDTRFPNAHVLGAMAALTPFETGREYTLLGGYEGIYDKGAVGMALLRPSKSHLARRIEQLAPMGPRLALTSARGNIISSLGEHNAAQQFLHLILERRSAQKHMDAQALRSMSSYVPKDETFYMGIFAHEHDTMPQFLTTIHSGHPMRGTLGVDTEVELSQWTHGFVQMYRTGEGNAVADAQPPARTRYLFLNGGEKGMSHALDDIPKTTCDEGVEALPGTFCAGSEKSWYARTPGACTHNCTVPHTSAMLYRT